MTDASHVLPRRANVVIVGGGIVGCSIAWHLAKRGISDVVLVEQNRLTSGTTWHAAGLVGQLRATRNLTTLARYTAQLFESLGAETGQDTGYRRTGSISVALSAERLEELQRQASTARAFGIEAALMSPAQIRELWPHVDTSGMEGGIYMPGDGQTNPVDTTMALATGAREQGVQIFEGVCVTDLLHDGQRVTGVATEAGTIDARQVVLAAGMWTRQLGRDAGISIPLQAAEHFYIVTEPVSQLTPGMPTLRIPDEHAYFKEDAGKLLLGAFEPVAKPWSPGRVPRDFAFGTLPDDFEHFAPILETATRRLPLLENAGIQTFFNGPESFSPDDRYLLGPVPELASLFVAAGFNSIGVQSAGGAGKVLADWMIDGHPPMDLWDVDIRRTHRFQSTRRYLVDRTRETLGLLYGMHWPHRQFETARGARRGPLHDRMLDHGAAMGELAGWERPNFFARGNTHPVHEYSYGQQGWFDAVRAECDAISNHVALFDMSSYPVFMVEGKDALPVLNRMSANNISIAPGRVVYTQWLNERGGIEADVTITRMAEDRFMVVSSCASETRDFSWLQQHVSMADNAWCWNATSGVTIIGIMGPASRDLLAAVTHDPVSDDALPFYHSVEVDIGYSKVRINRLSYVGELGFELYVPTEFALNVYETLIAAGYPLNLQHAGFFAMNACRIEKGYRHFGHDISDETDPYSAGLAFAVDLEKGDFTGREALESLHRPLQRRLVNIGLNSGEATLMYHDEPVFLGDEMIGMTTSGAWGFRVEQSLATAMISHPDGVTTAWLAETDLTVEIAGTRYPIDARLEPFYDPGSLRMKG